MHADMVLLLVLGVLGGAAVPLYGLFQALRRIQKLELRLAAEPQDDERVEQLQRTVDALTDQVAQLAESQEFVARLLSERLPPAQPRQIRPPEASTPH
ncbi:MAG TPA: hypothetical protein VJN95_14895 [Gemmatimonadales bacterium]|nr:hypothetical protein [Gemmatimonadales bacterium]